LSYASSPHEISYISISTAVFVVSYQPGQLKNLKTAGFYKEILYGGIVQYQIIP
jgi:hypothetical protein